MNSQITPLKLTLRECYNIHTNLIFSLLIVLAVSRLESSQANCQESLGIFAFMKIYRNYHSAKYTIFLFLWIIFSNIKKQGQIVPVFYLLSRCSAIMVRAAAICSIAELSPRLSFFRSNQ